jgi:MATE family multidrug resistance protein
MKFVSRSKALESRRLIKLAWPLLIAQLTQMLMGVIDTIMAGRYSAVDMAAVALGFSITIPIMSFIQGIALALPPLISRLHGAKNETAVPNVAQQIGYLLLLVSLLPLLLIPFASEFISFFPMEAELARITTDYVIYVLFAMPGFALYQWLRNYCEGLGHTKPSMIIVVIGLLVNICGNGIFVYGLGPIPEFGGAGCGIATTLVIYAMLVATIIYVALAPRLRKYPLFKKAFSPDISTMWSSFTLGLPIAMTILFEVTLFAVIAILLAPFGANIVAAHQVALNFSALMFMFPMSLGMAVSIRIGYRIGQHKPQLARNVVISGIVICLLVAIGTASLTIVARHFIISLYTDDPAVVSISSGLLLLAAGFQFSDAIQVISANALRGYKDTTAMFLITFCAYWLIGLPTGIILGRTDWLTDAPMAAAGFWIGIIVGLSSAAILLGWRLYIIQKRAILTPQAYS